VNLSPDKTLFCRYFLKQSGSWHIAKSRFFTRHSLGEGGLPAIALGEGGLPAIASAKAGKN